MRLLLALFALLPSVLWAEGFQGWYQNTVWLRLNEKWSIGNDLHLRADDGVGDVHTWIVSPRVRYDLNATWQLQANLSVLETFNADETAQASWLRFEFEINPTFRLTDSLTLPALREWCKSRLSVYKVPQRTLFPRYIFGAKSLN